MEDKVMNIIFGVCDNKIIYRNRDINLFETGLIDSMGFIELLVTFEEEFDVDITPEEIKRDQMSTPNQLIEFIRDKTNG